MSTVRYVVLFCLLAPFWTHASELEDCLANSRGSQAETGCYGEQLTRDEKQLQQALEEKIRGFKEFDRIQWSEIQIGDLKKRLIRSQTEWKKYVEAWCRYQAATMNGSGSASVYVQCQRELIAQRLADILSK